MFSKKAGERLAGHVSRGQWGAYGATQQGWRQQLRRGQQTAQQQQQEQQQQQGRRGEAPGAAVGSNESRRDDRDRRFNGAGPRRQTTVRPGAPEKRRPWQSKNSVVDKGGLGVPEPFDYERFKSSCRDKPLDYDDAELERRLGFSSKVLDGGDYASLNDEQRLVVASVLFCNHSVFFTGPAGTGKSRVLNAITKLNSASRRPLRVHVAATTGIAGVAVGGGTLNSFAGVGLGKDAAEKLKNKVMSNSSAKARWTETDILVVDEVSMMEGGFFDKLDWIGRYVRKNEKVPFGGLQVVLCGDFFQVR